METRLAASLVTAEDLTSIDSQGPFALTEYQIDEQALPDDLRPADDLLRRLASLPHHEPPPSLAERTLARCLAR
jgi:hypothetical protein